MKRIAFFVILLGFCVTVNADLIITSGGVELPNEVPLIGTFWITLNLEIPAGSSISDYDLSLNLCDWQGNLSQMDFFINTNQVTFPLPMLLPGAFVGTPGPHSLGIMGYNGSPVNGPGVVIQNLEIQVGIASDVYLKIISNGSTTIDGIPIPAGTVVKTLLMHQVPEPITLTLLVLGGLFIIKRKRRAL